jgi:hypothetical protein
MSDTVPQRKFMSEFAVGVVSARWTMIPPSELMRDDGKLAAESAKVAEHCPFTSSVVVLPLRTTRRASSLPMGIP